MVARDQLLKAIEQVESGGRRDAVSPKGARGRMQVMPATARQPGYRVKPARNETEEEYTRVGRDYAMALLNHYGGDLEATLVAYNYGPGNANKWIASGRNKSDLPKETRNYITRVGKQLGGDKMAKRPLEFVKQDKLSELTKKATKNPDSADARKVVRELIARGLPVPKKLQKTIGKVRAEAGIGSPAGEVPRPKRKPAAPKEKAVPRPKRKPPVPQEEFIGQDRAFNAPRGNTVRPPVSKEERMIGQDRAFNAPRGDAIRPVISQNRLPKRPVGATGPRRIGSADNQLRGGPSLPGRNLTEAEFATVPRPGRNPTEAEFATAPRPGRNPTEADFMYMIGQQRPDPSMIKSPMRSSPEITEEQFRAMRNTPRGSDAPIRENMQADYVSSGGRSQGRGGIDSGLLEFIEFAGGRDAFKPDALDRGLASLGGGEVDDPMAKAEATYLNSLYEKMYGEGGEGLTAQEQSFMDNFGKKKGGRLKKKKPVARKKAAPKKKKVVAKKKPVVRKKAVAKKPPMRKKTVAKKPASRKRAAKRGFGAELRGN